MSICFNPQYIAVRIESILLNHAFSSAGDADIIRKNPVGYMDGVLSVYEKQSEDHDKKSADFWDKYERYKGVSIDELGEELSKQLLSDISGLFG